MARKNNRYFYQDSDGKVHGPLWLSAMRDLWKQGRVNMRTEISQDGTTDWGPLEFHPEIFEEEPSLPGIRRMASTPSEPSRLLAWMIVLLIAFVVYQIIQYNKPAPRPASAPVAPESTPAAPR